MNSGLESSVSLNSTRARFWFLPARAAAAEDKAAVGQAAVVPEQLLLREKVHRGVVVGKVVGHGDDRLLDAGPVGPLLRHHKALPHVLLPGGQRRIGAAAHRIQGGGDRDGVLPRVPDAGDAGGRRRSGPG